MSSARFSKKSLRAEVRSTDGDTYGIDFTLPIDDYILEAEAVINDPEPALSSYHGFDKGSRRVVSYTDYSTVLALRVLGTYLRRKYSLQTETRETVSRGIIQALADSSTMQIVRRDIESFYETIPTDAVTEHLLYRDVLPPRARRMLEVFFAVHCGSKVGLPRGLGLSAVLSEYIMKPVDAAIRLVPSVYRYHRFVDDIVVFSTEQGKAVSAALAAALPAPMKLNRARKKQDCVTLPRPHGNNSARVSFDYLGYNYEITLRHSPKHPRSVRVGISEGKVNKLKTKIILSARSFLRDHDTSLFTDRIRYLSSNYRFTKRRPISSTGRSVVKSGIYYNYRYCGTYCGKVRTRADMPELRRLDWFLQRIVLSPGSPLGNAVVSQMTPLEIMRVQRLSFVQGHMKAFDCGLDNQRVALIKEAWRNV